MDLSVDSFETSVHSLAFSGESSFSSGNFFSSFFSYFISTTLLRLLPVLGSSFFTTSDG